MKKLLFALLLVTGTTAFAQKNASEAVMKYLPAFDTTWSNPQAKTDLANKFDLIAKKWPDSWVANYYAAYGKVQLSYMTEGDGKKADALLDEADAYVDAAAKGVGKEWDEIYVLRAQIANARMGVDPQNRWQKYGKVFETNLDKAKALNPENPRIYLLRGISKFYTPKMFGGGKKVAMPYFEKATALFAKEGKTDPEKPFWGAQTNDYFIKQATGEDKE